MPQRPTGVAPLAIVLSEPGAADERLEAALVAAGLDVQGLREREMASPALLRPPVLLVLDDGRTRQERLDAQSRLRAHRLLKGVPVVVISDDCGIDSFGGAIARGASAFLRRPLDLAELRDVAQRLAAWREPGTPDETRRGTRRPLLMDADVDAPGRAALRGRIVDASATGCRLELPEAVPAGTTLGIVPRSCIDSTEIRLGGTVRWSRPAGSRHSVAVRWTGTAALVARRILGLPPVR